MKVYLWCRDRMKAEYDKDSSDSDGAQNLDIKSVWQKRISDQQIIQKIRDYNKKFKALKKNVKYSYNKRRVEKIKFSRKIV